MQIKEVGHVKKDDYAKYKRSIGWNLKCVKSYKKQVMLSRIARWNNHRPYNCRREGYTSLIVGTMARLDILELISGGDYLLFVKEIFEYRIVVAGFREELMLKMSFTKKKLYWTSQVELLTSKTRNFHY